MNRIEMLEYLDVKGVGIEIGTLRGLFAGQILENANLSEFHIVDCWKVLPKEEYEDYQKYDQAKWDSIYEGVKRKFSKNKEVQIHKGKSVPMSKNFPNEYFDFIYIDANHSYEGVLADIKAWLPKLKKGGVIAGHDYDLDSVKKAVFELLPIHEHTTKERHTKSWFHVRT